MFDPGTRVSFQNSGAISATGPVDLGGSTPFLCSISQSRPTPGQVFTLVSTTGKVSGKFANATSTCAGITFTFAYTEHTVTATVSEAPAPVQPTVATTLAAVKKPTGPAAAIAQVLANGGYEFAFQPSDPGVIRVRWYLVPRGAVIPAAKKKPKALPVASGGTNTKTGKAARLKVKLSPRGRALLKSTKKSVKLTAVVEYTPKGKKATRKVTRFVLKR